MASPDDLAALFEDVRLEDLPVHHLLEIRFPVRDLLPNDTEPILHPPSAIKTREAPPADQRRLGIFQSSYVLMIPKSHGAAPKTTTATVETIFDILTRVPGKSRLDAAVFHDRDAGCDLLRLTLQVASKHASGPVLRHDFSMQIDEWNRAVEQSVYPWADALDELIRRSTNRAYYHVRNRLATDFGEAAAVAEEAVWGAGWGATWLREQERREATVEDIGKLMEDVTM